MIAKINDQINSIVWGPPMLILLVGAGIILTIVTGFIVFRKFGFVMKNTFGKMFDKAAVDADGITPFQAVSTALAATVGTGNIAGVATAIASGGPGAVFWMWLAAIVGLTTKYAEVVLSIAYREKNEAGEWAGGPMYYIKNGTGMKWLGVVFAAFGALAAFGIGSMTQSNSITAAMRETFNLNELMVGLVIAALAALILIGGIKRIGEFAEKMVPVMAVLYVLGAIVILVIERNSIPHAFGLIFNNAFNLKAAGGGILGFTMMQAMRFGIARGVFTNEAGLGSAPIAHAAAHTDHPVRQGIWGAFEVFIDTLVICTMTALVILTSGILETPATADLTGAVLTTTAFATGFKGGGLIVTFGILLFAFTTIVAWCYYGQKCIEYLFGFKAILPYTVVFIGTVIIGAVGGLTIIWDVSDTLNGLMAIPNLIGLIALSGVVAKLTKDFFKDPTRIRTSTDEYEHLIKRHHQKKL